MSTEPVAVLDDYAVLQQVDKRDMLRLISELPEQFETAMGVSRLYSPEPLEEEPNAVVFIGMGDSSVAMDIAVSVLVGESRVPVISIHADRLPKFVNERSIVVPMSYTGTSDLIVRNYSEARERGARVVCVTSGGPLLETALKDGEPAIRVLPGQPARTAIGYQFAPLVAILDALGLCPGAMERLSQGVMLLKNAREMLRFSAPAERNVAKRAARDLEGKLVVVLAPPDYRQGVAGRLVSQIGANSKMLAFHDRVPSGTSSRVSGWEGVEDFSRLAVVFLTERGERRPLADATRATRNALSGATVIDLEMQGSTSMEKALYGIYLSDFLSLYLAFLRQVDPTPTRLATMIEDEARPIEVKEVAPSPPEEESEPEEEE